MPKTLRKRGACQEIRAYREQLRLSQAQLARALGVTQAYVSQLECGARPVSKELAARLARLPEQAQLHATVFPEDLTPLDRADLDFAADLGALGYPGFPRRDGDTPKNPAAVIISILRRAQVAPSVMAAIPWVLLRFPAINTAWLVAQSRLNNLQNRLGFLTDLACAVAGPRAAAGHFDAAHLAALEDMRAQLEESRLVKDDTLARQLTPAERQFFDEHRSDTARHWNLLTGLTKDTLPFVGRDQDRRA